MFRFLLQVSINYYNSYYMMARNYLLPVIIFAKENYFEEDHQEQEMWEIISNFAEITVPNMNDNQFLFNFRLMPRTFEIIFTRLCTVHNLEEQNTSQVRTFLEKELLITIWYISNMESLR